MGFDTAVVVGGGIVGLAIAHEISAQGQIVTVLEKENSVEHLQTGRNSGVILAGPYCTPRSLKARLCTQGSLLLKDFTEAHSIPHEITGKLLIATGPEEF